MAETRKPTVIDIGDAIRQGLAAIGFVGQLDVRMDGSRSTSWVGKPSDHDRFITVTIADKPSD